MCTACFVLQNLEHPPQYEVKSCYFCFCAYKHFEGLQSLFFKLLGYNLSYYIVSYC